MQILDFYAFIVSFANKRYSYDILYKIYLFLLLLPSSFFYKTCDVRMIYLVSGIKRAIPSFQLYFLFLHAL